MTFKHEDKLASQYDLLAQEPTDFGPPLVGPSETARHFIALSSVRGVGRKTLLSLLEAFRPLSAFWEAEDLEVLSALRSGGSPTAAEGLRRARGEREALLQLADEALSKYAKNRISVLFRGEPGFPRRLYALDGPRVLFVQGNVEALNRDATVAIVGTRAPDELGLHLARISARLFAEAGFVVVSGLAEGIDAEVHATTLGCGGVTVAVLGNGLGIDFPASNRELRRAIVQSGGAIVTEYLHHDSYSKASFVQRNRIQAGLSCGVIPVQCKVKSGTAHTVRFARELGLRLAGVSMGASLEGADSVYSLLSDAGAPVFDLEAKDGATRLLDYFSVFAGDAKPPQDEDLSRVWRRAYRPALLALREVLRRREPDDGEREWLSNVIRKLLEEASAQ